MATEGNQAPLDPKPLPGSLINWLNNILRFHYTHKQVVYTHVIKFLEIYFQLGFKIRTKVYHGLSGDQLLLNLFGSLKDTPGQNFTLELWLPLSYPFGNDPESVLPIIHIVPDNSRGLFIQPSNFFDTEGRFYHPYLTSWFSGCKTIQDLKEFNLLQLFDILKKIIALQSPVISRNVPPKIPLNLTNEGNAISRQTTGPPLPPKPTDHPSIPLKYQSPLPLPSQQPIPTQGTPQHIGARSPTVSRTPYPNAISPPIYLPPPNHRAPSQLQQPAQPAQTPQSSVSTVEPGDLMDREDSSSSVTDRSTGPVSKISDAVNMNLQAEANLKNIANLNANFGRIDELHKQLTSHYGSSLANKENLENHLNYLTQQSNSLRSLNSSLQNLAVKNQESPDKIHISENQSINLDELIIADSVLVHQLYETVSEVKANKDAISVIGGSFENEKEIINDDNFDDIVKIVRNIGRESCWLELTKFEILGRMGIEDIQDALNK